MSDNSIYETTYGIVGGMVGGVTIPSAKAAGHIIEKTGSGVGEAAVGIGKGVGSGLHGAGKGVGAALEGAGKGLSTTLRGTPEQIKTRNETSYLKAYSDTLNKYGKVQYRAANKMFKEAKKIEDPQQRIEAYKSIFNQYEPTNSIIKFNSAPKEQGLKGEMQTTLPLIKEVEQSNQEKSAATHVERLNTSRNNEEIQR